MFCGGVSVVHWLLVLFGGWLLVTLLVGGSISLLIGLWVDELVHLLFG